LYSEILRNLLVTVIFFYFILTFFVVFISFIIHDVPKCYSNEYRLVGVSCCCDTLSNWGVYNLLYGSINYNHWRVDVSSALSMFSILCCDMMLLWHSLRLYCTVVTYNTPSPVDASVTCIRCVQWSWIVGLPHCVHCIL